MLRRPSNVWASRRMTGGTLLVLPQAQRGGPHNTRSKDHIEEPLSHFSVERFEYSVLFKCRFLVFQAQIENAEIETRHDQFWLKFDRALEFNKGILLSIQLHVGIAEIIKRNGIIEVEFDRF